MAGYWSAGKGGSNWASSGYSSKGSPSWGSSGKGGKAWGKNSGKQDAWSPGANWWGTDDTWIEENDDASRLRRVYVKDLFTKLVRGYPHAETGSCLYAQKNQTDEDFCARRHLQLFLNKHNSALVNNPAVGLSELASSVNVAIQALKTQGLDVPQKGVDIAKAFGIEDAHRLFAGQRGDQLGTRLQQLVFQQQGKACNDDEFFQAAYDVIWACQRDQTAMMKIFTQLASLGSKLVVGGLAGCELVTCLTGWAQDLM